MNRIIVHLGKYSYPIIFSTGLINNPAYVLPLKLSNQIMVITNETVASLYLDKILKVLRKISVKASNMIIPDGEQYKNLSTLNNIFTFLLQKVYGRDVTLIALGGGVISDLVGFAASIYQRGVRLIHIPTTLLSQIDASIGGKTAINHLLGKNMIGTFYQPSSVLIDTDFLETLPIAELASGMAEVVKYGISLDKTFFLWIEKNINALMCLNNRALLYCIYHCCKLKSKIISADERENNLRILLNLGHTYGHAIEVEMGYGRWLHGEAVAAGIVMAARTSELLGQFTKKETGRIISIFKNIGLPVTGPAEISAHNYLSHMLRDKKVLKRKFRLVLPIEIGKCKVHSDVSREIILSAISTCQRT